MAGYNIEGCTLHSAFQLPVRNHNNKDLQGTALQRLQLRFSGKQYHIIDELSYNFEKVKNLGSPIARISALHSGRNAKNATSDDAGGLDAVMFLARGAAVMLTCNLWQEVGVCNGATGALEDLLFHPDRPPPCLPIAALVHFVRYTGPAFFTNKP